MALSRSRARALQGVLVLVCAWSATLTTSAGSTAATRAAAVQPIAIRVDAPARVGFPIWVHADLERDLVVRYPFGDDPRDFGSNHLELKREGQLLTAQPGFSRGGPMGRVAGSIAPSTSPHRCSARSASPRLAMRWSVH
jgi:hypothetical protein